MDMATGDTIMIILFNLKKKKTTFFIWIFAMAMSRMVKLIEIDLNVARAHAVDGSLRIYIYFYSDQ